MDENDFNFSPGTGKNKSNSNGKKALDIDVSGGGGDGEDDLLLEDENDEDGIGDDGDDLMAGVDDLPLFAGPEAKKIHSDIQTKEEKVESLSNRINDMKERIKIMSEHFKNVQQEVEHTNGLVNSKKSEGISFNKHCPLPTKTVLTGTSRLNPQDAWNEKMNTQFDAFDKEISGR